LFSIIDHQITATGNLGRLPHGNVGGWYHDRLPDLVLDIQDALKPFQAAVEAREVIGFSHGGISYSFIQEAPVRRDQFGQLRNSKRFDAFRDGLQIFVVFFLPFRRPPISEQKAFFAGHNHYAETHLAKLHRSLCPPS
jgi:hypothetical protein